VSGGVARLIAALLAAAALLVFGGTAEAAFPGKNGRIAFVRDAQVLGTNTRHIWTIDPDGSNGLQITDDSIDWQTSYYHWNIWPAWSADAQRIVFASTRSVGFFDLWVMNADGTGATQLTDGNLDEFPSWSPDGSRVAFDRQPYLGANPRSNLWIVNADGTGAHMVDVGVNETVFEPSWSPDGARIAYSNLGQIVTVRTEGADRRVVTGMPGGGAARAPNWSPDGSQLAFMGERPNGDGRYDIWVVNADGSGMRRVAELGKHPAWSPDGTKISFSKQDFTFGPAVHVVNADGSDEYEVATAETDSFVSRPDWAPAPEPQRSDFRNGPAFCRALRDFLGRDRFAARYGGNPNGANAFGKCVSGG
jgi:Tol biopolymer transport system component